MRSFWAKKQQRKPMTESAFKRDFTLAERKKRRTVFKQKYPDADFCVAVIEGLKDLPASNKTSKSCQLIGLQKSLTGLHVVRYLKKSMHMNENVSLIIIVGSNVVNMANTVGELGERFTDQDGFLYIYVREQESF